MKFAITRKIGMSRIFDADGKHIAVTLLSGEKGIIARVKTSKGADGYDAVVVEIASEKKDKESKFYEFKVSDPENYKAGMEINVASFEGNEEVTVEGTGKGKGFAGTIKRHGFHRGPVTHGSHNIRKPGSIGGGYPQRVVPGKKMAGRMGGKSVITRNLKVMAVDAKEGIIAVSGAVPGSTRKIVKIQSQ